MSGNSGENNSLKTLKTNFYKLYIMTSQTDILSFIFSISFICIDDRLLHSLHYRINLLHLQTCLIIEQNQFTMYKIVMSMYKNAHMQIMNVMKMCN